MLAEHMWVTKFTIIGLINVKCFQYLCSDIGTAEIHSLPITAISGKSLVHHNHGSHSKGEHIDIWDIEGKYQGNYPIHREKYKKSFFHINILRGLKPLRPSVERLLPLTAPPIHKHPSHIQSRMDFKTLTCTG